MKTISEYEERLTYLKERISKCQSDVEQAKKNTEVSYEVIMLCEGVIEQYKKEAFQVEELLKVLRKGAK